MFLAKVISLWLVVEQKTSAFCWLWDGGHDQNLDMTEDQFYAIWLSLILSFRKYWFLSLNPDFERSLQLFASMTVLDNVVQFWEMASTLALSCQV